jgi:hypothetical protein
MEKARQGFSFQEIHGKHKQDDGAGRALIMKMAGERVVTAVLEYVLITIV